MLKKCSVIISCIIALSLLGGALCFAETAPSQAANDLNGIPIQNWTGQIFQVIPLEKGEKAFGYPFVLTVPDAKQQVADSTNVRADWLEGRKLEVVSVKIMGSFNEVYSPVSDFLVTFKDLSSGAVLQAKAPGGQVPQVVLLDDLINAQKYFDGKTVYSRRPAIPVFQADPGAIPVRLDEPLKIVDVIPGVTSAEPIWLVVNTGENKKGYIAISYSNTNAYQGLWKTGKPWATLLLEDNPRETYKWDEDIWTALNAGLVKPGMKSEQVRFVWGEPLAINMDAAGSEQSWVYPSKIVKFNAAGVVSVETR